MIKTKIMLVIISDLDGTLLDESYSFEAARPALRLLDQLRIPLVFCTSKTRSEVEYYRSILNNWHPFIVENGGALYMPERYFPQTINAPVYRDGCAVIEFGSPYNELIQSIARASADSGCSVRGFNQMSVEEISERCRMPLASARLAKQREYDEPFEILSGDAGRLMEAITRQKKRCIRGGSFYHIIGANDKAHCVNLLRHFYEKNYRRLVVTAGLGDGMNDVGFLNLVDIPILLQSAAIANLKKAVPSGQEWPSGPQGWNAAVLDIISRNPDSEERDIEGDSASKIYPD